jgi:hypothetical protein
MREQTFRFAVSRIDQPKLGYLQARKMFGDPHANAADPNQDHPQTD